MTAALRYPYTTLPLRARLYLDGDWRDVSADLGMDRGQRVTISRGQPARSTQVAPTAVGLSLSNGRSRAAATLDEVGVYAPRNVSGPWFGHLSRNVPLTVDLEWATDDYGRTVASGWGTSTSGHDWTRVGGAASDLAVAGGVGTQEVDTAAAAIYTRLDVAAADALVGVTVSLPVTDITGGSVEPSVLLRGQGTDYYAATVTITTAEAVQVSLRHSGGTVLAGPVTVAGLTHTTAQALRIAALCEGELLAVKVWAAASGEPYDWQLTATDDQITGPGWIGIRSNTAAGNTNVPLTYSYSDLTMHLQLAAVELGDIPQSYDWSDEHGWARIDAGGLLRRSRQGTTALQSAPRRYIPATGHDIVAYWPLEDGALATEGKPLIGAHPMRLISAAAPNRHFAAGRVAPWLSPGVALLGADELLGYVDMPNFVDQWAVDFLRAGDPTTNTVLVVGCSEPGSTGLGVTQEWVLTFIRTAGTPDGTVTVTTPTGVDSSPLAVGVWDGQPHHIRLYAIQDGADVAWYLDIDAVNVKAAFAGPTLTLQAVRRIALQDSTSHSQPYAVQHVVVYGQTRPQIDFARPVLGWQGETAGRRIERLCREQGIPFASAGDLDDTEPMGPQRVAPLIDLIQDAVDVDGGILGETRSVLGLWYRTRRSLYNQAATLALARGDTSAIVPADGDRGTRNHVIVTRRHGASGEAELAAGPLSVQDPPAGIGRYTDPVTLDLYDDTQCAQHAGWRLSQATWDGVQLDHLGLRVHALAAAAARDSLPSPLPALTALQCGDRATVDPSPPWCGPGILDQQAMRHVHRLGGGEWTLDLECRPSGPWTVWTISDPILGALDTDGSSLASASGPASVGGADTLSLATDAGCQLWTTDSGEYPKDLELGGGEVVTVTAMSGASSPQTATVTRGTNGVTRDWPAGTRVRLASRHVIAL